MDAEGGRWVIDASNVIGSRPDGWWRDRPAALARLVDRLATWAVSTGSSVLVVADGHPTPAVPEGKVGREVEVRYAHSSARDAADDEIVQLVQGLPDPTTVTVVTSDRDLADRCRQLGTKVEGARTFLDRMDPTSPTSP